MAAIMYGENSATLGAGAFQPEWILYTPVAFAFDEGKAPLLKSKSERKGDDQSTYVTLTKPSSMEDDQSTHVAPTKPRHKKDRARPTYQVHLVMRRKYTYYRQVLILTCLMASLSFCVYAVDISDFENRMPLVLTLLLTVVAFKLSIADVLPNLPYSTLLDWYIHASMIMMVTVSAGTTVSKGLHTFLIDNQGSSGDSGSSDTSSGELAPVDRIFAGQASTLDWIWSVDAAIGIILGAAWFLFNVDFVWRTRVYWCEVCHRLEKDGILPLTEPDSDQRVGGVENSVIAAQKVTWGTYGTACAYGWSHFQRLWVTHEKAVTMEKAEAKKAGTKQEAAKTYESAVENDASRNATTPERV